VTYRDHPQHTNRSNTSSILNRAIVCLIVFVLILALGWLTERYHRRSLHSPSSPELTRHQVPTETPLRIYELDHAHRFLPRQYVKILRYPVIEEQDLSE
jgi:hypothetical protein